jgi:hypothetical protein
LIDENKKNKISVKSKKRKDCLFLKMDQRSIADKE